MAIFLSHSGKQKTFVNILYEELRRAHHTCFFDEDNGCSLRKGDLLNEKIPRSISASELGVVVLSKDFMTSLWPMLELQNLIDANKLIYPIFYELRPGDLVEEAKLQQWEKKWNEFQEVKARTGLPFDIRKWRNCLAILRSTVGSEFNRKQTKMYPFINTVVQEICKTCRPQAKFFADDGFPEGKQRMAEDIENKFTNLMGRMQNQESVKPKLFVLGLYGMAGGGKTTLCKIMVDYYNERRIYIGASCLIDMPTDEVESDALVPKLKDALKNLTVAREEILKEIKTFEQAIAALQNMVEGNHFFLAIDNVGKWSTNVVKKILKAIMWDTNRAIRVIITSTDRKLLERLLNIEGIQQDITYVPTINSEEALGFIKTHMKCNADNHEAKLKAIIDGCFFNSSCNPSVLNIMAKKVEHADTNVERVLEDCIKQLKGQQLPNEDEDMDKQVISVPKKAYENINQRLQNIFMDTVILYKVCYQHIGYFCGRGRILYRWLRMLADFQYEQDMLSKLKELENYGMLRVVNETDEDGNIELEIHDLFIEVGKRAAMSSGCFLLSYGLNQPQDLNHVYVLLAFKTQLRGDFQSKLRQCSADQLKLLVVEDPFLLHNRFIRGMFKGGWLDGSGIRLEIKLRDHIGRNLRILALSCLGTEKITGLRFAPNLLFLYLDNSDHLQEIQDIKHLHKLQELHVKCNYGADKLVVPNLASCTDLRRLTLCRCNRLKELAELGCPPSMQVLDISWCDNLVNLEGLESLRSIQGINLSWCSKIEEFPRVTLLQLKTLVLSGCYKLRKVMAGVDDWYRHLPCLQVLDLYKSGVCVSEGKEELRLGGRTLTALRVLRMTNCRFIVRLEKSDS